LESPHQPIVIPCDIARGTFPTECWVRVDAELDRKPLPITAFVPVVYVKDPRPGSEGRREGEVKVQIGMQNNGHSGIIFPGELLSVSNPITVDTNWLNKVKIGKP
jgi:hypothetical protein